MQLATHAATQQDLGQHVPSATTSPLEVASAVVVSTTEHSWDSLLVAVATSPRRKKYEDGIFLAVDRNLCSRRFVTVITLCALVDGGRKMSVKSVA